MSKIPGLCKVLALLSLSVGGLFTPSISQAWDIHQSLMPMILNVSPANSPKLSEILNRVTTLPCEAEDRSTLQRLIQELILNPKSELPPTSSTHVCGPNSRTTVLELLAGGAVDDPDRGIDLDLPADLAETVDPGNDRKWMGGYQGPTSQGFRHMYFGGWKPFSHPLSTFQIPTRPVGQAPLRAEIMALKARELLKSGQVAWGTRVLGWALHYIQDLTQPFHSVQIVNFLLVPWHELLSWPPAEAFESLRKETTRIVTNLHWTYEGYTLNRVQLGDSSPYKECLASPEKEAQIHFDPKSQSPLQLAHIVSEASILLAPEVGTVELDIFGAKILPRGVDLTVNPKMLDYTDYAIRPDLNESRRRLHQVTCAALSNASVASRLLIEWAFQP